MDLCPGSAREPLEVSLATMSIGIATTATRRFRHPGEAVAVATEMKGVAKRRRCSSYAFDRRSTQG